MLHVVRELHPEKGATAESRKVRDAMSAGLKTVCARCEGGHWRVYLYPATGDVDGCVWCEAALGDSSGLTLDNLGDAFGVVVDSPRCGEMFFQGAVSYVVGESDTIRLRGKGSPLCVGRTEVDGFRSGVTNWFKGRPQLTIRTLRSVIINIANREPDFVFVRAGIRVYWSPVERRPDRARRRE